MTWWHRDTASPGRGPVRTSLWSFSETQRALCFRVSFMFTENSAASTVSSSTAPLFLPRGGRRRHPAEGVAHWRVATRPAWCPVACPADALLGAEPRMEPQGAELGRGIGV